VAKPWGAGEVVARRWTAYDAEAISENAAGDVVGPASATDGNLAVFDGTDGRKIKDGGAIPSGASFWTALANFTATPASTSTITMGTDQTATILVGSPLKYTIGGTVYYGMVSAITSNLLTVAGAPLGGDVTALSLGDASRIEQIDIPINTYYEDATDATLIRSDLSTALIWHKSAAYIVRFVAWSLVHDSTTHGQIQVTNGVYGSTLYAVSSTSGGVTIAADATQYSTVVDIDTAKYVLAKGNAIEIAATKNGAGDAHDLLVSIIVVYP
jgi:hypothetical protein